MRSFLRARANSFFVKHPRLGSVGYDILRMTGIDRSTRGVKPFLKRLKHAGFVPRSIIDVGANHGGWSRAAQAVFANASYFLIEPQSEMQPFLERFCRQSSNSRYLIAAAGAQYGKQLLTLWDDFQGSAIVTPEVRKLTPYTRKRSVPVVTIDGLIASGQTLTPDLCKIDVQGFELEVLRGGMGCLGKTDVFLIETSLFHPLGRRPSFYRVVELMESYGYAVYDIVDRKTHPLNGAIGQLDVCFVREGSALRPRLDSSSAST